MGTATATPDFASPVPGAREPHPTRASNGGRARRMRVHPVPHQRTVPITEERTQQ